MKDPTRIPDVVDALRRTWEGQPDLSLAALWGVLANRGVGWGTTDDELLAVLAEVESEHPSLIDASTDASYTISTASPAHAVTVGGDMVVVRSATDPSRMPGVWQFSSLRRTGPGLPLVITDAEGIDHRLGVVQLITAVDAQHAPDLNGLERHDVGSARWLAVLEDGRRCVIGQSVRTWAQSRRDVAATDGPWDKIVRCAEGEEFRYLPGAGLAEVAVGVVERLLVLET